MARKLDIEVTRIRRRKHTATILAVCALALFFVVGAMPGTQAKYSATDDDQHIFVFNDSSDVRISLTEEWDAQDGLDLRPGSTIVKKPVVTNNKADAYMRVFMRIQDADGTVLTPAADEARLKLILDTLWYDPKDAIGAGNSYSYEELSSMGSDVQPTYNHGKFSEPVFNETAGAYALDYQGIMKSDEFATLFSKICIPQEYRNDDIALMGDYSIVIWAQAIQAAGFDDQQSAMNALSTEFEFDEKGTARQ